MTNQDVQEFASFQANFIHDPALTSLFVDIEVAVFYTPTYVSPPGTRLFGLKEVGFEAFVVDNNRALLIVRKSDGAFKYTLYQATEPRGLYMMEVFAILQHHNQA